MMLRKNPPFEINQAEPFKDDKLSHEASIKLLTSMIQSADQPFVVSIEAPWGWGKTKFIERWKAYLENEKHICLHFNAWENDFVTDPLIAFLGELKSLVGNVEGDTESSIRKGLAKLQGLGAIFAKKGAPLLIKAAARKALDNETVKDFTEIFAQSADDIAEILSETVKKQIENYEEEKTSIKHFRKTLGELAENVTSGHAKQKQLVFFVDELDRCRPDFAITLLERIKHLFNVERIVFILAIDREQLKSTVRCLYGSGNQADAYLRRFIDFSFQLPQPSTNAFAELLCSRFKIIDFFKGRSSSVIEYNRFLPAFVSTSKWLNLDLRTQEQCFTRLNAIFHLYHPTKYIPVDAFCVLVGLRIGNPELYESLLAGKTTPSQVVPKPEINDRGNEFLILVESTLLIVSVSPQNVIATMKHLDESYRSGKDPSEVELIQKKYQSLEHLRLHRSDLIDLIEFSSRIH